MKAAVVTSFSAALEIVDRDVPEPAVGQVLVRLEACGLCHLDIHAAHGDRPDKPTLLPFVPGHEGVGTVEKLAMDIPTVETVIKGISIIGSVVGTRQDLTEVFAIHAAGKTRVIAGSKSLKDVNGAITEVLSGKVPARLVFDYARVPATA